jgi:hypothetical protein
MKDHDHDDACRDERGRCDCLPRGLRMNYFHGQLISERDLRAEQAYFRNKLRHAHRCLHGYGVLCGMEVGALEPPESCLPEDSARRKELGANIARLEEELRALKERATDARGEEAKEIEARIEAIRADREQLLQALDALTRDRPDHGDDPCEDRPLLHRVRVACGAAIDCHGDDVILPIDRIVDLVGLLRPAERDRLADGRPQTVYLTVCYEECGSEPTRPLVMDECATTNACQPARISEGARLAASLDPPEVDDRCEPCCTCCGDACVLLAAIEVSRDEPVMPEDIDHSVRRRFGLYDSSVITGISWVHGATYTAQTVNGILGTNDPAGGLEISFSRPVRVETIRPGVIELMRITGGRGLRGVAAMMEGAFVGLPGAGMVNRIRYRDATGEAVQRGDRIMVVVRAPFLLDRCCRPVEGLHVGGAVPRLALDTAADAAARREEAEAGLPRLGDCLHPPHGPMPWTTAAPGNFESWFWIADE